MEIDELKYNCFDHDELVYARIQYKMGIERGKPFEIVISDLKDRVVSQKYDQFGRPIGKPEPVKLRVHNSMGDLFDLLDI